MDEGMNPGVWTRVAALAIGGALGVNARYWLTIAIDRAVGSRFPWATFAINVSGAFALGLLAACLARVHPNAPARLAILSGFLGGYTTFSTFTLESRVLWAAGTPGRSLAYMIGSVVAGFLAVALGLAIGEAFLARAREPAPSVATIALPPDSEDGIVAEDL